MKSKPELKTLSDAELLHPVIKSGLNGVAEFFRNLSTHSWLAKQTNKQADKGAPFGVDYVVRVTMSADGEVAVKLLVNKFNEPKSLLGWSDS